MNNLFGIHFENQRISDLLRSIPELLFFLDLYSLDCRDPVALEELENHILRQKFILSLLTCEHIPGFFLLNLECLVNRLFFLGERSVFGHRRKGSGRCLGKIIDRNIALPDQPDALLPFLYGHHLANNRFLGRSAELPELAGDSLTVDKRSCDEHEQKRVDVRVFEERLDCTSVLLGSGCGDHIDRIGNDRFLKHQLLQSCYGLRAQFSQFQPGGNAFIDRDDCRAARVGDDDNPVSLGDWLV